LIANRKIGRHHLAFYRGWLQGLDLGQLADRYLESGLDLRKAKSTLSWIRDTFCQAALRHGQFNKARLLRLRLAQSNEVANEKPCPTLDEFREERDPDGFYREGELIELYLEEFPNAASKKTRQRQRLIERQIESLFWIGVCKKFCVNGHLAGNCRHFERSRNDRSKSTTEGLD